MSEPAPRLSTAFDYSNLRLHTDGTRVWQKSKNHRPRIIGNVVQDARSNWIAKDAGGSAKVPTQRKKKADGTEEEEDEDEEKFEGSDEEDGEGSVEEDAGKGKDKEQSEEDNDGDEDIEQTVGKRKRKSNSHIIRKAKKQKYLNEFDYLAPFDPPSSNAASSNPSGLPEPSSDLLNVIHRFASEFYHERGQLLNISRQYRIEKRKRELRRRGLLSKSDDNGNDAVASDSASNASDAEADEQASESSSEGESSGEDDDEETQNPTPGGPEQEDTEKVDKASSHDKRSKGKGKEKAKEQGRPKSRRTGRRKLKRDENMYIDMYKMFDGSAMMALGMLVQEQIAYMLNPDMPDDWKEEVQKVYGTGVPNARQSHDSSDEQDENGEQSDDGEEPDPDVEREATTPEPRDPLPAHASDT
ncbi:hypothetical protein D9613_004770 [Agrocybe pediades]|uniref:Uncharacterized protein n=1 Tax=Agrocybe pediades TaxID=84607 RepID=A0A8H4R0E3_9AGAR|nr:hypothetical protein D9613_004770 [Agrocybe pediades]